MAVTVRSFAKINLGLAIGPARPDGFHALETIYQTVAAHDVIHVEAAPGDGIEIRCANPWFRAMNPTLAIGRHAHVAALNQRARLAITIEKNLPCAGRTRRRFVQRSRRPVCS